MVERSWVQEALEEIKRLDQNPKTRRLADFKDRELKDNLQREEDAWEDGYLQGMAQGVVMREIVIRMHANEIPSEKIAKYIGLPSEKVADIIKSTQQ